MIGMLDEIACADCCDYMRQLPDASIDLTVTSPPYDTLRAYHGYTFDFARIATELFRITKEGGVIVWIVSDATVNGSETGTSFRQALGFIDAGFLLHDTMIWAKPTFSDVGSLRVRYAQAFEYMFILSKGKPKSFNPIKDRLNKYRGTIVHGSVILDDGSAKPVSGRGRKTVAEYGQRFNVWHMPTVQSQHERTGHPAQFPEQLAKDHILTWSNPGDAVFDPFIGSGTTAVAARDLGRHFLGCDISQEYIEIARKRLMGG